MDVAANQDARNVHIKLGNRIDQTAGEAPFASNAISTTKYNVVTFLPKNLFEQFQRIANAYFLIMSILATIPAISPVSPVTSWAPLIFVLSVTAIREAMEDIKRGKSDTELNFRNTLLYKPDSRSFVEIHWKDVRVGDLVKVLNNEFIPSDIVLLGCSDPSDTAYVETANLDGETNLKPKTCVNADSKSPGYDWSSLISTIVCPLPNNDIFKFDAYCEAPLDGAGTQISLSLNNLLMRGCKLKNTQHAIGVVVYTGNETKMMKNLTKGSHKMSNIESKLNYLIIILFCFQSLCCIVQAIGASVFMSNSSSLWYLVPGSPSITFNIGNIGYASFLTYFTHLILYSQMIPISLYVTAEVVKSFQAALIEVDRTIYFPVTDTPTQCRTSNLTEELGQVEYIFSDKTGTLTQNIMEFKKCTIGGVKYGQGFTEVERAIALKDNKVLPDDPPPPPGMDPGFNFVDDRIIFGAWKQQPTAPLIKEFLVLLGVCHSVQIENETVDGVACTRFAASSPDEAALVFGAANLGCRFVKRDGKVTTVNMDGSLEHYEVMADNEFNSTRKRQSLLVKRPNGSLILFCKGADTVIYDRLAATTGDTYNSVTTKHLVEFSEQGLRTLCLAFREISAEEASAPSSRVDLHAAPCNIVFQAKSWMAVYTEASVALVGREEKLMGVAELIEKDLTLIGATAIEDKLQVGVSETISHLAQANIKLWVLTGDKKETAINIGFACAVLTQQMSILEIDVHTQEEAAAQLQVARVGLNDTKTSGKPVALVVTGAALVFMLEPTLIMDFLAVSCECVSVICCRVSPLQKRLVTKMVKDNKKVITLSIGDGANDVPMIQAAHIGVGIRGLEGQQAAAASDYAIAQFRYLERLILVHGQWNYRRVSMLILYFFYKCLAFSFCMWLFCLNNGFSGQKIFDDAYQTLYNVIFTSTPIMAFGIFERGLDAHVLLKYPRLYIESQRNRLFSWTRFVVFAGSGIVTAIIMYYMTMSSYFSGTHNSPNGYGSDIFGIGTNLNTNVIVCVTVMLAMETRTFTVVFVFFSVASVLVWFLFIGIYGIVSPAALSSFYSFSYYYYLFPEMSSYPTFWLTLFSTNVLALIPISVMKWLLMQYEPELCDVVRACEAAAQPSPAVAVRPALTKSDVSPALQSHVTPAAAIAHNSKPVEMTSAKKTALESEKSTESKSERRESFGAELPGSITPASNTQIEKLYSPPPFLRAPSGLSGGKLPPINLRPLPSPAFSAGDDGM